MRFHLILRRHDRPPTEIVWDSDAGTVTGPGAEEVKRRLDTAIKYGEVSIHPHPGPIHKITDPYHRLDEFAAVIGEYWRVPEELEPYYPKVESPDPTIYEILPDGTKVPIGEVIF